MASPKTSDYLQLHFLVLIWSFTAILGLLISISSLPLVMYRTGLAALGLGVLLVVRGINVRVRRAEALQIMGVGMLVGLHWLLFFGAARLSNASACLAGMSTTSLWTSFLEPLFTRKKVQLLDVLLSLVVIAGLYLIFLFEFNYIVGVLTAVASAFLAALFSTLNSQLSHRHEALAITFYEMIGACTVSVLVVVGYLLWVDSSLPLLPQGYDWLWITTLAWGCTVFPWSISIKLLRRFSAFAMNLIINLEPVYGIVLAFLFFGEKERMTPGFYGGTLLILVAVLSYPWLHARLNRKELLP
ncbi:MAG: DMT family transporter [Spirosomataceae bacterium]